MKFRELGGILCMRGASLRMKGVAYKACVCSMLTYGAETWMMKAGVFQRLRATERRMLRIICGATLKDIWLRVRYCIESGSGRSRGAFEAEKIEVVWTYCKKR